VPWAQPLVSVFFVSFSRSRSRGRAHHHHAEVVVVLDVLDHVGGAQHALVEQVADGEVLWPVEDRHHGDDLPPVQVQRQRSLDGDAGFDGGAGVVAAGNAPRQARVGGVGGDA
jgi:hypothetical protein